jgi:hypothetical protein
LLHDVFCSITVGTKFLLYSFWNWEVLKSVFFFRYLNLLAGLEE